MLTAVSFKLQFHSDGTCSYLPALDSKRDSETIEVLPEFLRDYARFGRETQGVFFLQLFLAFNSQR